MAVPYNCIRISGTMPGGEVWSINPKFVIVGGTAVDDYQILLGWASSVAGLNTGKVFPTSWLQLLSPACRITGVRAEYYGADSKLSVVAEVILTTPSVGTGTASKPYQTAVVVSLRSGRPGRSYRGRIYLPAMGASMDPSTLRIPASATATYASDAALFLDQVADAAAAGSPVRPAIVSQTLGLNTLVSSVQVGDVLDTQRRRRDALAEAYATAPIPL